jgi:hypothetical protein
VLKTADLEDENMSNNKHNDTGHKEVCCNVSAGHSLRSDHNVTDHVCIDESSLEKCCFCGKELPSTSSVIEHTKAYRNRKAQINSEQPMTGHSSVEVGHQNGNVQGKLQSTGISCVPSGSQVCVKEPHTAPRADVQTQQEVSEALFWTQEGAHADEGGWNQQYETSEFQNIRSQGNGSFWCDVCEVILLNFLSVQQHILGKQHAKKLATKGIEVEHLWKTVKELEGERMKNICIVSHNRFDNIDPIGVVTHVSANTHQQKLKELKETRKKFTGRSQKWVQLNMYGIWEQIYRAENGKWSNIWHSSGETYHCEPCKVILSVHDVLAHVMDAPHQEKIKAPENVQMNENLMKMADNLWQETHEMDRAHEVYFKIDNSAAIYCTCCCVRVPATVQNLTDHIRGKTHMTTVIRHRTSQCPSVMKQSTSSEEENLPMPKVTQVQNLAETKLNKRNESVISENSQPKMFNTSLTAQEALLKALLPREKDGLEESGLLLQGKSSLFRSTLCDTETESEEAWNLHNCNQKCRIQASKQVAEGKNPVNCFCSSCSATVFCDQSDFAKHTCREVPADVLNGIAENAEQLHRSDATEPLHQENSTCEEQACDGEGVPRIVVSGKDISWKCHIKPGNVQLLDCFCTLVVRVPDYRLRGPGFES